MAGIRSPAGAGAERSEGCSEAVSKRFANPGVMGIVVVSIRERDSGAASAVSWSERFSRGT